MKDKHSFWNSIFSLTFTTGLTVLFLQLLQAECKCSFPKDWKGRWFQSGLGEVVIRDNVISQKGSCFEHHRDYVLLENKDDRCFQCLLFIKRHRNVIQYKESFCIPRDTLRSVCDQIRIETPLYTLVREPSSPTRCPFQDAYYFNYNDQISGFCDQPISYAKPCVGQNKFQFHFKHCDEIATWNGLDLDFDCLATWKDGSEMFMYGRFAGPGILSKDDSYRCFRYQYYGNDIYMSMSVDATCRGLRTARDGPFIMELTKDIFGWPPPGCEFPHWLTSQELRDVEGKHSYVSDERGEVLSGFYRRRVNSKPHLQNEYRCIEMLDYNIQKEEYTFLTFATHGCISKHQCVKVKRRADNVLELSKGNMVDYDSNDQCLKQEEYINVQLLIPEDLPPVSCPLPGLYQLQSEDGCIQHLNIGCENRSKINMQSSCEESNEFSLECLAFWPGSTRTYFIGRRPYEESRLVNCFSIRPDREVSEFGTDKQCNRGISNIFNGAIKHSIAYKGECKPEEGDIEPFKDLTKGGSDSSIDSGAKSRPPSPSLADEIIGEDTSTVSSGKSKERSHGHIQEDSDKNAELNTRERASSAQEPASNDERPSDSSPRLVDVNYNKVDGRKGEQKSSTGIASSAYVPSSLVSSMTLALVLARLR